MIDYYIDGSTKDKMIGVGIVKVNEFGFIERHDYSAEHISPTSIIAEAYSFEKTLELIKKDDIDKNELINIYTDNQKLHTSFQYHEKSEFQNNNFFTKQESNSYYQHLRNLYIELISRHSKSPIFHCSLTKQARPLIKLFFKDDVEDKRYLQEAHTLSRKYIAKENVSVTVSLKAVRLKDKWRIVKDNKDNLSENKRPLLALSEALKQIDPQIKQIKLCDTLGTILKSTNKNNLSNASMKSAIKVIEKHKTLIK